MGAHGCPESARKVGLAAQAYTRQGRAVAKPYLYPKRLNCAFVCAWHAQVRWSICAKEVCFKNELLR